MVLTQPLKPLLLGPRDVHPEQADRYKKFRVDNVD